MERKMIGWIGIGLLVLMTGCGDEISTKDSKTFHRAKNSSVKSSRKTVKRVKPRSVIKRVVPAVQKVAIPPTKMKPTLSSLKGSFTCLVSEEDHKKLAQGFKKEGKPVAELAELEDWIRFHPESFDGWSSMGKHLVAVGNQAAALEAIEAAAEIRPKDVETQRQLVNISLDLDDPVRAEKAAGLLVRMDPTSSEAQLVLARTYCKQNMWNECIAATQSATTKGEITGDAYNRMGYAQLVTGKYDDALVSFLLAVDGTDVKARMWNNLGVVQEKMSLLTEAQDSFKKALELRPKYVNAEVNLNRLVKLAEAEELESDDTRTAEIEKGEEVL